MYFLCSKDCNGMIILPRVIENSKSNIPKILLYESIDEALENFSGPKNKDCILYVQTTICNSKEIINKNNEIYTLKPTKMKGIGTIKIIDDNGKWEWNKSEVVE